jgi:hypothetical protein
MDLELGESQERQTRKGDRSEIRVVSRFGDLSVPRPSVERTPDVTESPAESGQRIDDFLGVFTRSWFNRQRAL